jgi:hypothetical protein
MSPGTRDARRDRATGIVAALIARPLLFVFWIFVLWGTPYAMALVYATVVEGPHPLERALSGRDPMLGGVNLIAAALAVVVWGTISVSMAVQWARKRGA